MRKIQNAEEVETELMWLQVQLDMDRGELFLYLANLLASGLLATHVLELQKLFYCQTSRYLIRRLAAAIKSLETIGLINVNPR